MPHLGEIAMIDTDEIVQSPRGPLTLGTALSEIHRLPPGSRPLIALWREPGCEPAFFDAQDIERMLALVEKAA
jgi:hypothetical protein